MQDSTYQLKQSIQKRDRKLVLLTEKIHTQIQLFDSMEKEAAAIKQVVNTVEDTVNGKEQEGLFLIKPYCPYRQSHLKIYSIFSNKQLRLFNTALILFFSC